MYGKLNFIYIDEERASSLNLKKSKMIMTHNGRFHADEIFAVAIFELANIFKSTVYVVRTRNVSFFEKADVLIDVGGKYDPVSFKFDHHQGGLNRENNIPYASAGLVWKNIHPYIIKNIIKDCNREKLQFIFDNIDFLIISPIDNIDCTGEDKLNSFSRFISSYNPVWNINTEKVSNRNFQTAVQTSMDYLHREILFSDSIFRSKELTLNSPTLENGKILVMNKGFPWLTFTKEETIFGIFPSGNDWMVQCVPQSRSPREQKITFPKEWSGLRGYEFIKITGVSDAIFCHSKLFICSAGSKEGAIKLAIFALKIKETISK